MLSRRRLAILAVLLIAFDALNARQQNRKIAAGGFGDDPDEKLDFWDWIGAPIVRLLEQVDRRTGSHLAIHWIGRRIYWLPYRGSEGDPYRWYRPGRFDKETDPSE
jgi:hypothetical protein